MKEYITKEAAINVVWDVLSKERRDNANTFHMISERLARSKAGEVQPVVHAHWVRSEREYDERGRIIWWKELDYTCSNCSKSVKETTPHCPKCGAIMDLK